MVTFIVLLLLLVVGGFIAFGWVAIVGTAGLGALERRSRAQAEARADEILDAAFEGQDEVVFKVNFETPALETVLVGAQRRGYDLVHERDTVPGVSSEAKTLLFRRVGATGT